MINSRFTHILRKTASVLLIGMVAGGLLSVPADAQTKKRRTFKAGASTRQEETAPAAETQTETPRETKTQTANQSRSSRRRSALPDDSGQTANQSVRNQTSSQSSGTSRAASTLSGKSNSRASKSAPRAVAASNEKGKEKSALQSIKVSKPNLEEIKTATLNPKSNFYYPKLWDKYNSKSPNMTPEEYRYLYLGYMFQEDYDPYRASVYTEYTDSLREKTDLTRAEHDDLILNLEKSLNDNPFDLRQISYLINELKESKPNKAGIWRTRLENLLAAIKSTGTGVDANNAWYVIYPMHEYDMVQLLGYRAVDINYDKEGFDYLLVEPDGTVKISKPAKGFYFNVEIPQKEYMAKHPED